MDGNTNIRAIDDYRHGPINEDRRMKTNAVDDIGILDLKKSLYDDNAQVLVVLIGSQLKRFNILATTVIKLLLDERNMRGLFFCFDRPSSLYTKMFEPKVTNLRNLTFIDPITKISGSKGVSEGTIVLENPFQEAMFDDAFRILGEILGKDCPGGSETCFGPVEVGPAAGAASSRPPFYDFMLIDNLNSATYYMSQKKVENFVIGLIDLIRSITTTKVIITVNTDGNKDLHSKLCEICNREVLL